MIKTLDYYSIPSYFAFCLNNECIKSNSCLRYQASRYIPSSQEEFKIINPCIINTHEQCQYFRSDSPIMLALGCKEMFNKMPHQKAVSIKHELLEHYGKNCFYRYWRKEKVINAEAQKYISSVFRKNGITIEPVYDEYREEYQWQLEYTK